MLSFPVITSHIRGLREGNVFTRICLSVYCSRWGRARVTNVATVDCSNVFTLGLPVPQSAVQTFRPCIYCGAGDWPLIESTLVFLATESINLLFTVRNKVAAR